MARPLVAHVEPAALAANLARVRGYAPRAKVLAVVKANAYGHGLERVLPALGAADGLALIELDAAIRLRERGYRRPLLLLEGFFDASELGAIAAHALGIVVHSAEQVRMLEQTALVRPLDVYLKINSGMNRLRIDVGDARALAARLDAAPSVAALHLMTHLAAADAPDGLAEPLARLPAACERLPYTRPLANSARVVRYADIGADRVRPGIMLYGSSPFAQRPAAELGHVRVMTLRSRLIAVQSVARGESVGYGATFVAREATRIGVVACGYADGYPRHAPNGTPVLVCGRRVPMAGRVSMDMLTVDLSSVPQADVGSDVVLWGEGLPVDDVAQAAGTVGYELLCAIAPRVPFAVQAPQREAAT